MESRIAHSVQIKLRTYDAPKVWDVIKAHDLPCVAVKHTWSYRTRSDCQPHVHLWIQLNKPLTVETFNAKYIKKGLPDLDGRRESIRPRTLEVMKTRYDTLYPMRAVVKREAWNL